MAAIVAIDTVLTVTVDGLPARRGPATVEARGPASDRPADPVP
jgi:hypothetical protein